MIRPLFQADLLQVLQIEKAVHIAPWTAETFDACFSAGYLGWVMENQEKILGFIMISLMHDECHILNICVDHPYQRQGFGRRLLEYALNHARESRMGIAYLEVRRSNTRAISLYRKMNFAQIGERKGYYPTVAGDEDALVFAINLKQE